jgi:hypothetical protein
VVVVVPVLSALQPLVAVPVVVVVVSAESFLKYRTLQTLLQSASAWAEPAERQLRL